MAWFEGRGGLVGLVGVLGLLSGCGDDGGGGATDGATDGATGGQTGDSTAETSAPPTTGDAEDTTGGDATTGDDDDDATGDDTGTTGEIDEGPFADAYRIALYQTDQSSEAGAFWTDVDADGATGLEPLIPGGDHGMIFWMLSPGRRWLVMRGGSDIDAQGWVIDTAAIDGGNADTWAFDLEVGALSNPVFFDEDGALAYIGQLGATARVYARTLGDDVGPAVEIQSTAANATVLTHGDDTLVLADAALEIHTAPAEVAAGGSVHAADLADGDMVLAGLYPSADGTAVYVSDLDGWWVAGLEPAAPPTLSPIAMPPEVGNVQAVLMTEARNRIVTVDYDGVSPLADPIRYVDVDGTTVSPPISVPIPAGPEGALTSALPQLTADGNTMYVAASSDGDLDAAYAIDFTAGPAVTVVAGPGVDDSSVSSVYLSHDEARLFCATRPPDQTIKMVDFAADSTPIDLAPDLEQAYGTAGVTLVESEDGRAVYFLGRARLTGGLEIWRVGIVDGVPTSPVSMAEPAVATPTDLYPAPDGGGLAILLDGGALWFSMYDDGEPAAQALSTEGMIVERNRPPLFLTVPR